MIEQREKLPSEKSSPKEVEFERSEKSFPKEVEFERSENSSTISKESSLSSIFLELEISQKARDGSQ
jgi:hypothetical protein